MLIGEALRIASDNRRHGLGNGAEVRLSAYGMVKRTRHAPFDRKAVDLREILDMHRRVKVEAKADIASGARFARRFENRGYLDAATIAVDQRWADHERG